MDRNVLVYVICDFDYQAVAFISVDSRTWKLSVYGYQALGDVQTPNFHVANLQ